MVATNGKRLLDLYWKHKFLVWAIGLPMIMGLGAQNRDLQISQSVIFSHISDINLGRDDSSREMRGRHR